MDYKNSCIIKPNLNNIVCVMRKKNLTKNEQEIFKILKAVKKAYTMDDFLQAREKAMKKARQKTISYW